MPSFITSWWPWWNYEISITNDCRRCKAEAWLKFQILEPQNFSHLDIEFLVNLVLNRETMAIPTKPTKEDLMCLVNSSVAWNFVNFHDFLKLWKNPVLLFSTENFPRDIFGRWTIYIFGRFGTKRKSARLSWIAPLAQFLFCAPGDFRRWLEGDWTNFPSPWPRAVLRYILWCRDTLQVWNYTEKSTYLVSKSCFFHLFFN